LFIYARLKIKLSVFVFVNNNNGTILVMGHNAVLCYGKCWPNFLWKNIWNVYVHFNEFWIAIFAYMNIFDMLTMILCHRNEKKINQKLLKNKLWTTVAFLRCCNLIWGLANNNYSLYFLQFLTISDNLRLCYKSSYIWAYLIC
jgi:hypothetical protein